MIFESLGDKEGGRSNINTPKGASFAGGPLGISHIVQNGSFVSYKSSTKSQKCDGPCVRVIVSKSP